MGGLAIRLPTNRAAGLRYTSVGRAVGFHDIAAIHHTDPVDQRHGFNLIKFKIDGGGLGLRPNALQVSAYFQPQQRVQIGQRLVHQ